MGNKGGFSWKRAAGVTKAKQKISRKTGIPLTKSGRQRKVGKAMTGGGCSLVIGAMLITFLLIALLMTSLLSGCSSSPTAPQPAAPPNQSQQQTPVEPTTEQTDHDETESITQIGGVTEPTSIIQLVQTKVTSVTDGDTVKVTLDGKTETVRLIGVDTPETVHPTKPVEPYGPEASEFAKANLNGKTVWLEFDAQERDQYGRLLAYVWVNYPSSDDETSVRERMFNAWLLDGGYAKVATYPPNVKYVDYFTAIQAEVRDAKIGVWATPIVTEPEPEPEPEPEAPKEESQSKLTIISYTQTVAQGDTASITIQGKPNTQYTVTVTYKSGPSKAAGLDPKKSDTDGKVTWSWKVGSNTTAGFWPIDVKGGGESVRVKFTVQ